MVEQIDIDLLNAICGDHFEFKPSVKRDRLAMIAAHRAAERARMIAAMRQLDAAMVEAVAKGICRSDPLIRMGDADGVVEQRVRHEWKDYRREATAALAAAADAMEAGDAG